ncbi:MAG: hypothetical protein K0R69_2632, partial [Clostridia bacterium]|nr:hypothetical protein [Clostridia bacterium]
MTEINEYDKINSSKGIKLRMTKTLSRRCSALCLFLFEGKSRESNYFNKKESV